MELNPARDGFEPGQQVRRDVARLSLRGLSAGEAHAAALHQTEEERLLLDGVLLPDQPGEILAREAPRVSQPGYRPAAVENRVDGVERPCLVEDDAVGEEIRVVEHHAGVMEVVEGVLSGDDASDFVREPAELGEGESPMLPLLGRAVLVLAAPVVEPTAHFGAPLADLECAVPFEQVAHGVTEMGFEGLSPQIVLGAVGAAFEEPGTIRPRWIGAPVREPVALALHDDHRAAFAGESPHVVEPVGERLVAQGDAVLFVLVPVFELRSPEDQEDGAAAQEERMSAVIDVLSSEIPPVHLEDLFLASGPDTQLLPPDLHAMGGRLGLVERLAPEAPAELGLPDAAIAEQDHLHLVLGLGPKVELGEIGAQS